MGIVYVGNPDPAHADSLLQKVADKIDCRVNLTGRSRLTMWKSTDGGRTYPQKALLDEGLSAQTSIQVERDGTIYVLYEQADPKPFSFENEMMKSLLQNMVVLLPNRFVLREVPHSEFI